MQNTTAAQRNDSVFNRISQLVPTAQERATITFGRVPSSLVLKRWVYGRASWAHWAVPLAGLDSVSRSNPYCWTTAPLDASQVKWPTCTVYSSIVYPCSQAAFMGCTRQQWC